MNIAIIPARGGSKRIPKKNIQEFMGKPIIAWSIQAAINSELFHSVLVSTDDESIADVAIKYGAEVPFMRPNNLSDDYTGTNDVVKHAIKWIENNRQMPDFVCCIYATAPFIQKKYLVDGYHRLLASEKSFAFSVTSFAYPVERAIRVNSSGTVGVVWENNFNKRSQDLECLFHDAGQFYWGRPDAFIKNIDIFSEVSIPIILPRHLTQDIDTFEDWKHAELLFKSLLMSGELDL